MQCPGACGEGQLLQYPELTMLGAEMSAFQEGGFGKNKCCSWHSEEAVSTGAHSRMLFGCCSKHHELAVVSFPLPSSQGSTQPSSPSRLAHLSCLVPCFNLCFLEVSCGYPASPRLLSGGEWKPPLLFSLATLCPQEGVVNRLCPPPWPLNFS